MHMRAVEHTINRGSCTHHAAWVNHTENRCKVHAAEDLEVPVGEYAGPVARAVHPCTTLRGEGIFRKALFGLLGQIYVAASEAVTADEELPGLVLRHGVTVGVE